MPFRRTKTAPTPYPRLIFHGIRFGQALSSLVVTAVMSYFIWNMVHEKYEPPKTFWTLLAASLLTFFFLIGSLGIYVFTGLSPKINLIGNGVLLGLWAPGFAFLWFFSKATLSHVCNRENWVDNTGIMVCRIYKALFAFSMLGTTTTLLAVLLDVYVWRKITSRGKYSQMNDGEKPAGIAAGDEPYNNKGYSDSRNSFSMENYTTPQTQRGDQSGYQIPDEQFNYSDTAYHGGHEPMKRD